MHTYGGDSSLHGVCTPDAATGTVEPWQPGLDGAALAIAATDKGVIVGDDFRSVATVEQSYLAEFGH
jgi:hypothetical protein